MSPVKLFGAMKLALPVLVFHSRCTGRERAVKTARLPHALLKSLEHLGIGLLDRVTDQAVVARPSRPNRFWDWAATSAFANSAMIHGSDRKCSLAGVALPREPWMQAVSPPR